MTEIQPVYDIPALKVENCLVIGDLHIGVESHLRSKGFHLVSRTTDMHEAILAPEIQGIPPGVPHHRHA